MRLKISYNRTGVFMASSGMSADALVGKAFFREFVIFSPVPLNAHQQTSMQTKRTPPMTDTAMIPGVSSTGGGGLGASPGG